MHKWCQALRVLTFLVVAVPVQGALVGPSRPAVAAVALPGPPGPGATVNQWPSCDPLPGMPDDVSITPAGPEVPSEIAALSGVWQGAVEQGAGSTAMTVPALLAVEEIGPSRARILWAWGGGAWIRGGAERRSATVLPGGRLESGTTRKLAIGRSPGGGGISGRWELGNLREGAGSFTVTLALTRCTLTQAYPAEGPGRLLLRDDFTNPGSGWARQASDPATSRLGYEDGEYAAARLAGNGRTSTWRRVAFNDYLAEVDARLQEPTASAYVFLVFRRQDNGDRYQFTMDPNDGSYTLLRWEGDRSTPLIARASSPAIRPGGTWNRVGVRLEGPEIVLLVNDQELARTRDDALPAGRFGFGVGASGRNSPAEARFDNLLITSVY